MLKLAGVFLLIMVVAGILGFVVHVAAFFAKIAFFACLLGFLIALAAKAMRRG